MDFDKFDDPNFNPFETKSKVENKESPKEEEPLPKRGEIVFAKKWSLRALDIDLYLFYATWKSKSTFFRFQHVSIESHKLHNVI